MEGVEIHVQIELLKNCKLFKKYMSWLFILWGYKNWEYGVIVSSIKIGIEKIQATYMTKEFTSEL